MRKKIIAANWKMNLLTYEAGELLANLSTIDAIENVDIVIAPSNIYLSQAVNQLSHTHISVSAQNIAAFDNGAYTGEVSAQMIKDLGVKYCIIGHSERRTYFNEDNEVLLNKVNQALKNNLKVIFCVGETLDERNANKQNEVINEQITSTIFQLKESDWVNIVIAYEPVWAIGTGVTASENDAQQMHAFIRNLIKVQYNGLLADKMNILYGGSCNKHNAKKLFACPDIDGGLIGGASLNFDDFFSIIHST